MKVDASKKNPVLCDLLAGKELIIAIDANIIIPPERHNKPFPQETYYKEFIYPLFNASLSLLIHESVLQELVDSTSHDKIVELIENEQSSVSLVQDASLTDDEKVIRSAMETSIAPYTMYTPHENNSDDRGEVKTLSYLATKGHGCFLSKDSGALRLITHTESLETSLNGISPMRLYEIIYYMTKTQPEYSKTLRALYKYNYYLSKKEKAQNPSWEIFIQTFDKLYGDS